MSENTIVIKIECCVTNAKRQFNDMDDSRMNYSYYARFLDDESPMWYGLRDSEQKLLWLKTTQEYANEKLRAKGHLFLNEVYEMLGIPKSKAGREVGWVYNADNLVGDNYVDFDIYNDYNRHFVNGENAHTVLLDFNVDGCILDYI